MNKGEKPTMRRQDPGRLLLRAALLTTSAFALALPDVARAQSDSDEIVVTARKRAENIQDVPISISAVSGEDLERLNITSVLQLDAITPSLNVGQTTGFVQYSLRGVSTNVTIPGVESAIATYVDGVYIARPTSALQQLPNIERIEVLRGPQGTLFGRNATGGLINIVTRQPSDKVTVRGNVSFGNGETLEGSAFVSGPLTDKVSVGVSLNAREQSGGFGTNLRSGADLYTQDYLNIRGQMRVEFDETLDVTLAAYVSDLDSAIPGSQSVAPGARPATANGGLLISGPLTPVGPANFTTSPRDSYQNIEPIFRLQDYGASLTVNKDWDNVSFTSISAYNSSKGIIGGDFDTTDAVRWCQALVPGGVNIPAVPVVAAGCPGNPTTSFVANYDFPYFYSQELRLASNGDGPLQWVAGVYGQRNQDAYDPIGVYNSAFQPTWSVRGRRDVAAYSQVIVGTVAKEAYAVFAQGTYAATDKLDLTVGARYNYESIDYDAQIFLNVGGALINAPIPNNPTSKSETYSRPTWLASASYDFSDNLMAYASYNRGFRSGTFNTSSVAPTPVDEEIIDAYEVGFKSEIFDGLVRVNGAAFFYDYQNLQFLNVGVGTTTAILQNAGGAEIKGLDLEISATPFEGLNLFANIGLLDTEYTEFPSYGTRVPQVNASGAPLGGTIVAFPIVEGNPLTNSPEYTVTVGGFFEHPVANRVFLELNGDITFKGEYYLTPEQSVSQDAYSWINASVGLRFERGQGVYRATLWGRNLSDEDVITSGGAVTNTLRAAYAEPLVYGVRLSMDY